MLPSQEGGCGGKRLSSGSNGILFATAALATMDGAEGPGKVGQEGPLSITTMNNMSACEPMKVA